MIHAEETKQFDINVMPVKNNLILGEPIMIRGVVKYIGTRSLFIFPYTKDEIEFEGKCEGSKYWHDDIDKLFDWKQRKEISAGWELKRAENITWCIKTPQKIRVRYKFYFEPPGSKEIPSEIWRGHITSEWQEINVAYPAGIDAEAFQALLGPNFTTPEISEWIQKKAEQIIDRFPTSTYAGWVLWHNIYHTWHEDEEKSVHSPENVVLIVLDKMPFESKKDRKNLQTINCSWTVNRNQALMEKLVSSLKEGEPRDSIAECLAEQYFDHKKYDEAIRLFKLSSNHYRAQGFIEAIRKYMPEYSDLLKK